MAMCKLHRRIALAALALLAVGCGSVSTKPAAGVVAPDRLMGTRVGSLAPDATFLDRRGTRRSLSAAYEDATVLVFTSGACTQPDSRLVSASESLGRNVALIQISSCYGECCRDHSQCLQTLADKAKHMIAICDPREQVRVRYGMRYRVGASPAVFVLDRRGIVVAEGPLEGLADLADRASRLAYEAEQERDGLYGG